MRFLLFGDSGEKDPDLCLRFAEERPARVGGIFICRVPDSGTVQRRDEAIFTNSALEAADALVLRKLLLPEHKTAVAVALGAPEEGDPGGSTAESP